MAEIADKNLSKRERASRQRSGKQRSEKQGTGEQGPGDAGPDALAACAAMLAGRALDNWPDVLLMIGDQVYADEPGPATRRFIAEHRAGRPASGAPDGEVADFAEYCALYREAWSDPAVRWLFSVVPTAMIFDDHDVHDDWNTSGSWRGEYTAKPWWGSAHRERLPELLGLPAPRQPVARGTRRRRDVGQGPAAGDAAPVLADLAHRADQRAPGIRWSFARTFPAAGGEVRVVMLDSRSRRVVEGTRLMADEAEWRWLTESVTGDLAHVVIATSVPPLLPRGIHTLEAWTERLCGGAWGRPAVRLGERLRARLRPGALAVVRRVIRPARGAAGRAGQGAAEPRRCPASHGDDHLRRHAPQLPDRRRPAARPRRRAGPRPGPPAPAPSTRRCARRSTRPCRRACATPSGSRAPRSAALIGTAVATLAGARVPRLRWRVTEGPWFDNMIATLTYAGPRAVVRFDRAVAADDGPRLAPVLETDLA